MSDLVGNPEDLFSHNEAHILSFTYFSLHYANMLMQYGVVFKAEIRRQFLDSKNVIFCSKHRYGVNLIEAVLTSTHNLCFRAK